MKHVQVTLEKLLLSMRDGYLSRPPAASTRLAPLGFAPIAVPVHPPVAAVRIDTAAR